MSLLSKFKGKKAEELSPDDIRSLAEEKQKANLNKPIDELSPEELKEVALARERQLKLEEKQRIEQEKIKELRKEKRQYYIDLITNYNKGSPEERFLRFLQIISRKYDVSYIISSGKIELLMDALMLHGLKIVEADKKPTIKDCESYTDKYNSQILLFDKWERALGNYSSPELRELINRVK